MTIKYSSAGVGLWTNRYNGPANGDDGAGAMVLDRSNNVIITGSSGTYPNGDYTTVAYSSAGVPRWTNRYNGPGNGDDRAVAVAVDARGNVFVTGSSYASGRNIYATIAYSNAGVPLWTNYYNGPGGFSEARAVTVDVGGNVYVTGSSAATNLGSPSSFENLDYTTIKYAAIPVTPPVITNTVLTGTNLVFAGYGGSVGAAYYVVGATNAATPLINWTRLATNTFDAAGTFTVTNPVKAALGRQFFRLEVP